MALFLAGCGGGGGGSEPVGRGEVTGIVFDTDGKPVANASVYVDRDGDRATVTDSAGRYVLRDVAARDLVVRAEFKVDDLRFYGQNLGRVFTDESTPNVNVTLYDEAELVSLTGQIRDSGGRFIEGARVVARASEGNVLSSASALTNRDGIYTIGRLARNVEYQVVASSRDFGDDSAFVTIPSNPSTSERTQDLVLKNLTTTAPETPTNVQATAFTTPGSPTARGGTAAEKAAYEGIKRIRDPKRAARAKAPGRDTPSGSPISIDLTWAEYPFAPPVRPTGFLIYRDEAPTVNNGIFLQDPLAVLFSDSDVNLQVGSLYTYSLKSVSTGFEENSNVGRSALSASASARPLDTLFLNSPSGRTVSWDAVAGADRYLVYAFSRYPDIFAIDALVFSNESAPATGTSLTIDDPDVVSGTTFYYVVVGERSDGSARTFSKVGTFQP